MTKPEDVKKLRELTGVGFGDCKKALDQANGDFKQAEKILKEMGLAQVAKRADKVASEGRVFVAVSSTSATMIELSCNTDFVAKNDDFVSAGNTIAKMINEGTAKDSDQINNLVLEVNTKCKEKVELRFAKTVQVGANETVGTYVHGEMGSLGAMVVLSGSNAEQTLAKDLCMHISAFKPQFLKKEDVTKEMVDEQTEIFKKQMEADEKMKSKPASALDGILKGKLDKHFNEFCFLTQSFVKDDKKTVEQVLPKGVVIKEFVLKEKGL